MLLNKGIIAAGVAFYNNEIEWSLILTLASILLLVLKKTTFKIQSCPMKKYK